MTRKNQPFALYEQIKQHIVEQIDSGRLGPDDRVPSETQLARSFKASRMTANRALKELAEDGRIVRIQGVGTFVARPRPDAALLEIRSMGRQILDWGGTPAKEVLLLSNEPATLEIAQIMEIEVGAPVFHSILLHRDGDLAVQYSERYVNPGVAPDYLDQDFLKTSPSEYLVDVAPVQEAEHTIQAVRAPDRVGVHLGIDPEEPCLSLTRITRSFNQVATYNIMVSPGMRYQLKGKFIRG
ncbi:MAG: UTRA domain-containing protein [Desulfobacterales bacterium]|nr:UTRA domain-containing protein [Desulfobacterales bacterium]